MTPIDHQHHLLALLLLLISFSVKAQLPGFVSIDCGSSSPYNDPQGIEWTPDSAIINNMGTPASVQPPQTDPSNARYSTIRYFPPSDTHNFSKFCYLLPLLDPQGFYLVRASFWLGNNSNLSYPPPVSTLVSFKLLIDADPWADIVITLPQLSPLVLEIYKRSIRNSSMAVCLSGASTGSDIPFISSLELRPLQNHMKSVLTITKTQRPLQMLYRVHYGALPTDLPFLRYPDDLLDRLWASNTATPRLSTSRNINTSIDEMPPLKVLQTAYVSNPPTGFHVNLSVDAGSHSYYFALYFSEIDARVNGSGQRAFDVSVNAGAFDYPAFDVYNLTGGGLYGSEQLFGSLASTENYMDFSFRPTPTSIYMPFIAGMELFQLFDNVMSPGTFESDIAAIDGITSVLLNLSSYTGDPCLPSGFAYPWLNCSWTTPPRITVLSLSNYSLVGEIPKSINDLTGLLEILLDGNALEGSIPDLSKLSNLQVLNLSNNKLTGSIPSALATLPNLRYLYLQNNNLSGAIPAALLGSPTLQFDYAGNPFLCTATSNKACSNASGSGSPHHIGLIVGLSILGLVVLALILGITCYLHKTKHVDKKQLATATSTDERKEYVVGNTELVEASNAATVLSYQDIEVATGNFSKKLGEGGFGPVYEGRLANGRKVAIKVAKKDSKQGTKEFLNEVGFLSRVHHKNLVGLLGYCTEQNLVLVYEYMSKGSLLDCLYGKSGLTAPLTWRQRLRIALDAAQGLEYLHHGCSPRIIHRDVKSSNILLDEKMEAKIADFGISTYRSNDTGELATSLMGTLGYLDPEYASTFRLTDKVDVYSFGVFLFELICGRPPIDRANEEVHIVEWVRPSIERGMIEEIVDAAIGNEYNMSSMWKIADTAMTCVEFEGIKRPSMSEVCGELRQAIRMEFESYRANSFERTTEGFSEGISLTNVQAR